MLAHDVAPDPDLARQLGFRYVGLDELYATADIVSLHVPSSPETRNMLDAEAFRRMKDGAVVINTARGDLIDTRAWPSAGGIAMILEKAYGPTTVAAGASLLMALSMVINESLVARTFGTYTLRAFGIGEDSPRVPVLGVGLIVFTYLVNISGNRSVGMLSVVMSAIKVGGIALFGAAALWVSGLSFQASGDADGTASAVSSRRSRFRSSLSRASPPSRTAERRSPGHTAMSASR